MYDGNPELVTKREFKFILPVLDNEANSLKEVHTAVQEQLVSAFGGYSMYPQKGAWKNEHGQTEEEISMVYTVSVSPEQEPVLKKLINVFGLISKQDAVYTVNGAGYVDIAEVIRWRDPDNWQGMANQRLKERRQANRPWN